MQKKELDWLRDVVYPDIRKIEDRKLLQAAAAQMQACDDGKRLTKSALTTLDAALRSRSTIVTSSAARWLFRLANQHEKGLLVLWNLFRAGPASARQALIRSVNFNDPVNRSLERQLVREGLESDSAKIRLIAGDRALGGRWHELLPELEAAAARDGREHFDFPIRLLRDGYIDGPPQKDEPRHHMTVLYKGGIVGVRVPAGVVRELGPSEVARRIRLRNERTGRKLPGESWDLVPDPADPANYDDIDPGLTAARVAYAEYESTRKATQQILRVMEDAIRSESEIVVENAAAWLVVMASTSRAAAHLALRLIDQCPGKASRALMQSVYTATGLPAEFELKILRVALKDPTPLVRKLAGIHIQYNEHRSLMPALKRAIAVETDADTLDSLNVNAVFLKQGYIAEPAARNRLKLIIALGVGTTLSFVPAKIVEEVGLDEVARRIRARHKWKGRRLKGRQWDPI